MQNERNYIDISIDLCDEKEIDWVNQQYQKLNFKPSELQRDHVAIAKYHTKPVALGRLCRVEKSAFELGGMYVQEAFRGMGIARQLIQFLLGRKDFLSRVYCLPFIHLQSFYESEGFREVSAKDLAKVPLEILDKHSWCNETYPYEVLLLELDEIKEGTSSKVARLHLNRS